MPTRLKSADARPRRLQEMEVRLRELEETLRAIRAGEVDAVVVSASEGDRVFTLQGADHPYRVMVETINEGAATLNPDGLVVYANGRFAEMVGLPLEKIIGSSLHGLVLAPEGSRLEDLLERSQTAPQKEECSLRISGDGLLPVSISLSALKGTEFQGICMLATDLTEQKNRQQELARINEVLEAEVAVRKRAEQAVREAEEVFRSFMNHTPAIVTIKDEQGRYVYCNKRVEEVVGVSGQDLYGKTPADFVPGETGRRLHEHDLAALSGSGPTERVETVPAASGSPVDLLTVRFPFRDPSGRKLMGSVGVDVTEQKRAEASLRQVTGRLLSLQDEERRRIARDLHDSTAQTLASLSLNLRLIQAQEPAPEPSGIPRLLAKSAEMAEQAFVEIRNISHLLHPPALEELGLMAAIQGHANRVTEVSGIDVTLDLPADMERLPKDVEIALFRVLQESLENVRRHSGSKVAAVRVVPDDDEVLLEIKDQGHGAPHGLLIDSDPTIAGVGVGVAGMRERLRQLGGNLKIESGERGTTVTASVPVPWAGTPSRGASGGRALGNNV